MKLAKVQLRGILFFSLSIFYFLYIFFNIFNKSIIVIFVFIIFLYCFPHLSRYARLMTIIMLVLGNIFFFQYNGHLEYWEDSVFSNLSIVVLIVFVPIISFPLYAGDYINYINSSIKNIPVKPVNIHIIITSISFVLTAFLNLGSVRIMYELLGTELKNNKTLFVKAIMQGVSLATICSPYIVGVGIVLYLLDIKLVPFLFYGIIIVISGLVISMILNYFQFDNRMIIYHSSQKNSPKTNPYYKPKIQLLLGFLGLISLIIALENILSFNFIIIISLTAMFYPFLWIVIIKKAKEIPILLKDYFINTLPNIHNEIIIIITASFFSKMVQLTLFPKLLSDFIKNFNYSSMFLAILIIIFTIVGVAALGIHPIVPVTIFATNVASYDLGITSSSYALILTTGWGLTPLVSPISAFNILSCNTFNLTTWQVIKWNWEFIVLIIITTSIVVTFLN